MKFFSVDSAFYRFITRLWDILQLNFCWVLCSLPIVTMGASTVAACSVALKMEEDTEVNLGFDKALLYKNMVAAEADWLYNLEEWNDIFDEETRKALYKEQKSSTTIVKEAKIYPNDPCPCGSGKKYKKCCGRK